MSITLTVHLGECPQSDPTWWAIHRDALGWIRLMDGEGRWYAVGQDLAGLTLEPSEAPPPVSTPEWVVREGEVDSGLSLQELMADPWRTR